MTWGEILLENKELKNEIYELIRHIENTYILKLILNYIKSILKK